MILNLEFRNYGRFEFYRLCEDTMPLWEGWRRFASLSPCEIYTERGS